MTTTPICPYCEQVSTKVKGKAIFPFDKVKHAGTYYLCEDCNAYIGCHQGTDTPLGRLNNKELRYYKKLAHNTFDKLWKQSKLSKSEAYEWIAGLTDIPPSKCHIGMFDIDECIKVINLAKLIEE